jgi:hypothetical protein
MGHPEGNFTPVLYIGRKVLKVNIQPNCTYIAYKMSYITENKVRVHKKDHPVNTV